MKENKIKEKFDFFTSDYLELQHKRIFVSLLIIIESRYHVFKNNKVNQLVARYCKDVGIHIPDELKIGNGRTIANAFINKLLVESGFDLTNKKYSEEYIFYKVNSLIDKKIDDIIDMYPRDKLLVNLVVFADFVSTLSQNDFVAINKDVDRNNIEKILNLFREIDDTKNDLRQSLLGEIKESTNYLLNRVLLAQDRNVFDELEAEKYFEKFGTDYYLLFCYGVTKSVFLSDMNSRYLIKRRFNKSKITFSCNKWGDFPPRLLRREFDEFVRYASKETLGLQKCMSESIFPKFYTKYQFDPLKVRDTFKSDINDYKVSDGYLIYLPLSELLTYFQINQIVSKKGIKNEILFLENNVFHLKFSISIFIKQMKANNINLTNLLQKDINEGNIDKFLNEKVYSKIDTTKKVKEIFKAFVSKYVKLSKEVNIKYLSFDFSNIYVFAAEYISLNNLSIFHKPLIKFGNYYLTNYSLLNEGLWHLAGDILSRNTGGINDISKDIKCYYDENKIPQLKSYISSMYDFSIINCDFMASDKSGTPIYPKIKRLLMDGEISREIDKGRKKELDIIFYSDNTLYIYDLKNYGIQHSLVSISKLLGKVKKEISKLKKIKKFILENKSIFESDLGIQFDNIEVGILTANSTIFEFCPNMFNNFYIDSVQNFISENTNKHQISYLTERQKVNRIKKIKSKNKLLKQYEILDTRREKIFGKYHC
ncbi:hypothetical protein [Streptococcus salivarius]|uniref:hypothetical protein n=1 Tax=Streptococcus salivarius TaxID=1304 RepID=UPI00397B4983